METDSGERSTATALGMAQTAGNNLSLDSVQAPTAPVSSIGLEEKTEVFVLFVI